LNDEGHVLRARNDQIIDPGQSLFSIYGVFSG
jgi:hypothetical protein